MIRRYKFSDLNFQKVDFTDYEIQRFKDLIERNDPYINSLQQQLKEKGKTIEKLRMEIEHAVKYLEATYGYQLEIIDHVEYEPEHEMLISFKECLAEIDRARSGK